MMDLIAGEQVLWSGRPARFALLDAVTALLVAWGLGLAAISTMIVLGMGLWLVPAFLVLAPLIGYMVIGRPVAHRMAARDMRYLVTDRRVIVWARGHERSDYVARLPQPHVDGDTIRFGRFHPRQLTQGALPLALVGVDATQVCAIIERQRARRAGSPTPADSWEGRPIRIPLVLGPELLQIGFGVAIVASLVIGVLWGGGATATGWAILVVFAAGAVWPLVARHVAMRRTRYRLAGGRLVVTVGRRVNSVPVHALPPPIVQDHGRGLGTVWFGDSTPTGRFLQSMHQLNLKTHTIVLRGIRDAQHVRGLIAAHQSVAHSATTRPWPDHTHDAG